MGSSRQKFASANDLFLFPFSKVTASKSVVREAQIRPVLRENDFLELRANDHFLKKTKHQSNLDSHRKEHKKVTWQQQNSDERRFEETR